jgi:hypothetical protein
VLLNVLSQLKDWLTHFYAQCFGFFRSSHGAAIIVTGHHYRAIAQPRIEQLLATGVKGIHIAQGKDLAHGQTG